MPENEDTVQILMVRIAGPGLKLDTDLAINSLKAEGRYRTAIRVANLLMDTSDIKVVSGNICSAVES